MRLSGFNDMCDVYMNIFLKKTPSEFRRTAQC